MTERGILFRAMMVKAILAGRKTQTRRLVVPSNSTVDGSGAGVRAWWPQLDLAAARAREQSTLMMAVVGPTAPRDPHLDAARLGEDSRHRVRPRWEPGDRLWVRETFVPGTMNGGDRWVRYRATDEAAVPPGTRWTPGIHMPRWASRLALDVVRVRVERIASISAEDARAEGVEPMGVTDPGYGFAFRQLWYAIHGEASWVANPWVWVIEFKRVA